MVARRGYLELAYSQERRLLTRAIDDPVAFFALIIGVIEAGVKLRPSWHVAAVLDECEKVIHGENNKLSISLPPGGMKSFMVSVATPARWWMFDPTENFLCFSGNQTVMARDSRRMRRVVTSDVYRRLLLHKHGHKGAWGISRDWAPKQEIWGLAKDQNAKTNFENDRQGSRVCTTIKSGITGNRANVCLIDDPIDVKEVMLGGAERIAERVEQTNAVLDSLKTRMKDRHSKEILIMQSLHVDDPSIRARSNPSWRNVVIQAEHDPEFEYNHPMDPRTEGQVLDEELLGGERLDELKRALGDAQYSAQYQQLPVSKSGGRFPVHLFEGIEYTEDPHYIALHADEVAISLDCANKKHAKADYTAIGVWARWQGKYWLLEVKFVRLEFLPLWNEFRSVCERWPMAHMKYIEDKASGTQIIQTAGAQRMRGVVAVNPSKPYDQRLSKMSRDKFARSIFTLHALRSGMIRIPRQSIDPAVGGWVQQHQSFPKGRHDDLVDMTSQIIERWWCDDQNMQHGGGGIWDAFGI